MLSKIDLLIVPCILIFVHVYLFILYRQEFEKFNFFISKSLSILCWKRSFFYSIVEFLKLCNRFFIGELLCEYVVSDICYELHVELKKRDIKIKHIRSAGVDFISVWMQFRCVCPSAAVWSTRNGCCWKLSFVFTLLFSEIFDDDVVIMKKSLLQGESCIDNL